MKNTMKIFSGLIIPFLFICVLAGCKPETKPEIIKETSTSQVVFTTTDAGDSGITIEMTTATKNALIYYTTDGSTPTISSTVYAEALTCNTDMTIKAMAVKEGLENSPVASLYVNIGTKTCITAKDLSTVAAGTYDIHHLQQNVTGGMSFADYTLASTDSSKEVAEESAIEDLKNTYEGFTAKFITQNETDIYIFYDRNTINYTFNTGSIGVFIEGANFFTIKTISGLYGADCTLPDEPYSQYYEYYKFVKWLGFKSETVPSVFGAKDMTFVAIWDHISEKVPGGFVKVTGGASPMGSEEGDEDNKPVHNVVISRSFYMCDHEVTQSEYKAVMGSNPSRDADSLPDGTYANKPVDQTSWYMAIVYCNKKSIKESLTPCYTINGETNPDKWGAIPKESDSAWNGVTCNFTANGYRLPTEAEWEYAARAGDNTLKHLTYSGTSDSSKLSDYAWFNENAERSSHEVKQKKPNALGLYDMSGNVSEWCWDWFAAYTSEDAVDPTGSPGSGKRVHRGGAAFFAAFYSAVSERIPNIPEIDDMRNGFRVCRSR